MQVPSPVSSFSRLCAGIASSEPILPENNLQSKSNDSFPNGSKGSFDLPDQEVQCVFTVILSWLQPYIIEVYYDPNPTLGTGLQ